MKISILGSGSNGNSIFIEENNSKILIDAGFSCKKIEEKLNSIGEELENIEALLITHEHTDHILGAGIISRKYDIPLYITKESYLAGQKKLGKIEDNNLKFINGDFIINGNIKAIPFDVMHDAERTIGFRLESKNNKKIAISTDIGYISNIVRAAFSDVDVMVIESNYDYNMLMNCGYPFDLKARIKSNSGHLSNNSAVKFIKDIHSERLQKAFLAHISRDSNTYDVVRETLERELHDSKINLDFEVALQDFSSTICEF